MFRQFGTLLLVKMKRRRKKLLFIALLTFSFICLFDIHMLNDFVDENNYLAMKGPKAMLVDLPGCTIPLEIEDSEKEKPKITVQTCDANRPQFTYIRGNRLFVNSTYSYASCCYRGIQRKSGTDNAILLGKDCTKIDAGSGTEVLPLYEAVVVICDYGDAVFDDYHAVVHRKLKSKFNSTLAPKLNTKSKSTSKSKSSGVAVPNVLIIGLDSVSRFHFEQLMPKTKEFLEQKGSIEMLGYTKVGDNTFPNALGFLTGYSVEELKQFCYNQSKPIDDCPFIWKDINMKTAFLEDEPQIAIFNYFKFGFLQQPVDHYLRPLMLAVAAGYLPFARTFPCIGSRGVVRFMLDHMEQLLLTDDESPVFIFSWLTALAHDGVHNLPGVDLLFVDFFQKLNLTNTIVILMSDHGHRFGDGRRSFNGWFNEKLPFFTITLPPHVKNYLGDTRMENLESNAKKLTTPYEVYHTLSELLVVYNVKQNENGSPASKSFPHGGSSPPPFPRSQGQSLFSKIPDGRNCSEAGIPLEFCACYDLEEMSMRDPLVEHTVRHALVRINNWLPRRCKTLEISQITAAAKLNEEEFIVGFTTKPGDFKFEIRDRYDGPLLDPRITRTNEISAVSFWCVSDWTLELFCYCDVLGFFIDLAMGSSK